MKFLHLSDLHFITDDKDTQYDQDNEIREALLDDLGIEDRTGFDAVLVTGDVAYHGKSAEFERANEWFDRILQKCGVPRESLFTVPGNHDVNQKHVSKNSVMWDAHVSLRGETDKTRRDRDLKTKCTDRSWDFLHPLKEYRDFAAQHGRLSTTSANELAWSSVLTSKIATQIPVRLHGLNSAFLSDGGDIKANLLVSPFQFHRLASRFDGINIVMCHHPPSWLLDGEDVEDRYRKHASIVLTGHEHTSKCYPLGGCLRICAGAVHPSRGEANWNPGYNVIRICIENEPELNLVTQVETRVWHKTDFCFVKSPYPASEFYTHRHPLAAACGAGEVGGEIAPSPQIGLSAAPVPEKTETDIDAQFAAARRKLIIHFYRLGLIARFDVAMAAGVWEDSDDRYEGQARWARVFDRAEKCKKFHTLWARVAERDDSLQGIANPFPPQL